MRTKPYSTAILVFDEVELLDVSGPLAVLSAAGRQWNFQPFKLELVAASRGSVSTRSSLRLEAPHDIASHRGAEVLIVPGGYGARRAARDPATVAWLRETASQAQIVASIGNGALLLARAGVLDGREVAVLGELAVELAADFPLTLPKPSPLCQSDHVLSARASALSLDLSCEIVARCFGKKLASALSASLGIDWSGELDAIEILPGPLRLK